MNTHVTTFQKTTHFLFVLLFFSTLFVGKTYASNPNWIKSSVNGNFYAQTPPLSWTAAEAWSRAYGGHLVTLRSWSEELWVKQTFGRHVFFWIGLNVIGREHSAENFYWSSGEPVTYTNWAPYEPNNADGIENVTEMNFDVDGYGDYWNDMPNHLGRPGIAEIVTYDQLGLVLGHTGEVFIVRIVGETEVMISAKKGVLIKSGDRFFTYNSGLVEVALPSRQGSRTFIVYPDSEIRINEASTPAETTMEFFKGKMKGKIKDLPKDYLYEILTPQAVIGVRGTEFIVEGDESYTKITVLDGSVEVTTRDNTQSVTVNENYAIEVTTEDLGDPFLVGNEPEYFAGGFGTETDPWLIETAEHLNHLRHFLGEGHHDKHFKQTAHIDLSGSPWNEGEGWVPIGTADNTFYGHYDGNGKEISNLYINRHTSAYQGLFGVNNGTIANLGIIDASITDHGSRVGILTGLNNFGTIDNCHTSGTIQSDHEAGRVGGLAGWNYHVIKDSHSTASVSTLGTYAGGITGVNYEGSIIDCYATGDVYSELGQSGGLVGYNRGAIISCYTSGKTIGGNYMGGLTGVHSGSVSTIENSYSTADVTGHDYAGVLVGIQRDSSMVINSWSEGRVTTTGNWSGGLVGYCADNSIINRCYSASEVHADGNSAGGLCGTMKNNATIENSYATGAVSGMERTGGLVGWADSSHIFHSYAVGYVSSETEVNTGGLTGGGSETEIVFSFWDTTNSGQVTSAGGEGKNTLEMISQNTFTNWNFNTIWYIDENSTYPYLQWQLEPHAHNYPAGIIAISAHAGANGSIAPAGEVIVEYGSDYVFTITPDEGFCVAYIKIDGVEIDLTIDTNWDGESGQYTFADVTESRIIEVGFVVIRHVISAAPNNEDHGTVTGGGEYDHFEQVTLTATPATGYHFVSWTEEGEVVSDSLSYTFTAAEDRNLLAHFAINTYLITATAEENGSISPAGETEVEHGHEMVLTILPDDGYCIAFVMIDGVEIDLETDANWDAESGQYTFINVTGSHAIEVGFVLKTYAIVCTPNNEDHGTVTGDGDYDHFDQVTLTATPATGYHFVHWTEDGEVVSDNAEYTFTAEEDRNLVAHFEINTYTISATPNSQHFGSITGDGDYDHFDQVTLTATPATGYHFVHWTENGAVVSDNPEYTFTAEEDRNLVAHFAINTYLITATAGENGSISPAGETEVEHGSELVLTITPDEGYRISFISIDGTEINLATDPNWDAATGQYTFSDVTEAHTIEVGFEVATDISEAEALQQLTLYPNPAKEELWVAFFHQGDADVDLVLLNIHGQVVQQVSVSASGEVLQRMATHGLTPGVYLLTIRGGEAFPAKKVVIEN